MEKNKKIKSVLISAIILFACLGVSAAKAKAATLSLSPYSGSYEVGQFLSVKVSVTSQDTVMNAASGVISFPQDKLEVTSLSKTGSIISLWAQDPSFSNDTGIINFEGIVLNPGFQGSDGKILTINFKAKAAGTAPVVFASGSILANDGIGTNIISGFVNANFGLKPQTQNQEAGESTTPSEINPLAPQISSPTHPNPNNWYNSNNPKFTWNVPDGVTAIKIQYDKYPQSVPSVVYTPAVCEKSLQNIPDGIWYFHVQFRDANGWGSVAHFRFQIDTKSPEKFAIKFVGDSSISNPRPTVLFNTVDDLSGIDFYKIKVGDNDAFSVQSEQVASNPYTLPPQVAGKHTILVQAFDHAGNYETAIADFTVLTIASPTFTDYPPIINQGNPFVVKGLTFPSAKVWVWLQKGEESPKRYGTLADSEGNFTVAVEGNLEMGQYQFWAEVEDDRGAKSLPSDKLSFNVSQTAILRIGSLVVNVLAVVISVAALLVLGGALLWYGWRRFHSLRRGIRKEVHDVEQSIQNAFKSLRGDVRVHINTLEKEGEQRALSHDEEKMLNQLRKSLDKAEKLIKKEVEDIEKKVR